MHVVGPAWPSTEALRAALADAEPLDFTLRWGLRLHDGWQQLVHFAEAGVPCPDACNTLEEAQAVVAQGVHMWGRMRHHTQGSDIVGEKHRRWSASEFWVRPLVLTQEFRQHVWDGRCIRVGQKVQTGPQKRRLPVRSRRNGWTIDYAASPEEPLRSKLRQVAKQACTALGYIGGAVDLGVTEDGTVYALEVNTAPALRDERTLVAYVVAIKRWTHKQIREGGRRLTE